MVDAEIPISSKGGNKIHCSPTRLKIGQRAASIMTQQKRVMTQQVRVLYRSDDLSLISKTNFKNLDGICASITSAFLCKMGGRDRRIPRSSGTCGTGVQSTAETSRESCFNKAEGEYQLQEVVLYPSHMYCSILCMHTLFLKIREIPTGESKDGL